MEAAGKGWEEGGRGRARLGEEGSVQMGGDGVQLQHEVGGEAAEERRAARAAPRLPPRPAHARVSTRNDSPPRMQPRSTAVTQSCKVARLVTRGRFAQYVQAR